MRTKHTLRLPPDLADKLADYSGCKRVPQALIVEAALACHRSPEGADRLEAALSRRLDRITRHLKRIERLLDISPEALGRRQARGRKMSDEISRDIDAETPTAGQTQ
jgi:uncharacterized protein YicC (UPF0701 family)